MLRKIVYLFAFLILTVFISGCAQQGKITNQNGEQTLNKEKKSVPSAQKDSTTPPPVEFTGQKGEKAILKNNQITLDSKIFNDGKAHFYNTEIGGKLIHFFVVKDKNGVYRAAANACQVCASAKMGFRQVGGFMVCNTCGNRYPLEKIATQKGGCNPVPINPSLEVKDGKVIIDQSDLKQIVNFF